MEMKHITIHVHRLLKKTYSKKPSKKDFKVVFIVHLHRWGLTLTESFFCPENMEHQPFHQSGQYASSMRSEKIHFT